MGWIETFHFIRPLWLLALLPAGWLLWNLYRRSTVVNQWQGTVDPELLAHLLDGEDSQDRKTLLFAGLGLAWFICVLALAGPSWERRNTPTFRNVNERVLVVDLSRSMNAEDIKPSRLGRVRQKITDILDESAEVDNAIVVFAAAPFVVAPLTNDTATIRSMLPSLSVDIMPAQGSRIGPALRKAHELLKSVRSRHGRILLFTDSSIDADALIAAEEIAESGLTLSVIGVGSADGAPIPQSSGGFLKDRNNNIVIAQLDEKNLETLARAGAGQYRKISTDQSDIDALLSAVVRTETGDDAGSEAGTNTQDQQQVIEVWLDRGPWLVFLLLPMAAVLFRRGWL